MPDLEKILFEVGSFFDEWRVVSRRMSLNNQSINPNKEFFDRLERELKEKLQKISSEKASKEQDIAAFTRPSFRWPKFSGIIRPNEKTSKQDIAAFTRPSFRWPKFSGIIRPKL